MGSLFARWFRFRNPSRYRLRRFEILVERSLERLPPQIRERLTNVIVEVQDEPEEEILLSLGLDPETCPLEDYPLGLYEPMMPELDTVGLLPQEGEPYRILIFAGPLTRAFPNPRQLMIEIRKTVVHETLHHFGWTDEDMEELDDDPDPFS